MYWILLGFIKKVFPVKDGNFKYFIFELQSIVISRYLFNHL